MKLSLIFVLVLAMSACASKTPKPQYKEEKNQAKYADNRSLKEKPDAVLNAARAVLDELTQQSDPPASDAVKSEGNTIYTGWVYGTAKDKYVQYDYNGSPQRKALSVRRIYGTTVAANLAGSLVSLSIEEEIQDVDLKSGEPKGWKRVRTDPAALDMLMKRIRERIRAQ